MNNTTKGPEEQVYEAYADANLFIYAAIDKGPIGQEARRILREVKKGKYKIYTATLTVDEFLWRVKKEAGRELAGKSADIFFTMLGLGLIDVSAKIVSDAVGLYKSEKLDPRDAIHLACMNYKNLKKIISSDPDFDKIRGIKRIDFSGKK
jgi:predicted nucleic acid-binding protein